MSAFPTRINIDEARQELAIRAQRTEAAHRPRHLILLALVVVAAAMIALVISISRYMSAQKRLGGAQEMAQEMTTSAGKLRALKLAASDSNAPKLNEPVTQLLSRIQGAGRDAGLKNEVPLPQTQRAPGGQTGVAARRITAEARDLSLDALLLWVQKAQQDIPGLEVYSVMIKPEQQQWVLKVVFSRWERTEGAGG